MAGRPLFFALPSFNTQTPSPELDKKGGCATLSGPGRPDGPGRTPGAEEWGWELRFDSPIPDRWHQPDAELLSTHARAPSSDGRAESD